MASRSFSSEQPGHPHLVTPGKGGVGGEVGDLRRDVEDGFAAVEADFDARISAPVKLATVGPLNACTAAGTGVGKTLTQDAAAVENIDGTAVVLGDRVLVKNQVAAKDNGIYVVTTVGTVAVKQVLTRATDFDADAKVKTGKSVRVTGGATLLNTSWELTTANPITLDTTALTFAALSSAAAAHHATHENGGGDELSVAGLSGELADPQPPKSHMASHLPSGGDALMKTGTATSAAGGDEAVAFGVAFADANYKVYLGNIGASAAVIKAGTKVAGGFTLTFGAAGDCDWVAIHD